MVQCNPTETNKEKTKKSIDLSIIPISSQKQPFKEWKGSQKTVPDYETWYTHYLNNGYIGIICGEVSLNLEALDFDLKNDPTKTIEKQFRFLIPEELFKRLIVVKTPSGGYHYIYRCPKTKIDGNLQLAWHTDGTIIIETRGEGGYLASHVSEYQVIQGTFDILRMTWEIPEITPQEREFLLETARSLNRNLKQTKPFTYKDPAITRFNEEFDIIPVFEKHNWSVVEEDGDKILLLRERSTAHHSGTYFKNDGLFFCFSTSTLFEPKKAYNHFQVIQELEGNKDYKTTVRLLAGYGYATASTTHNEKVKVSDQQIAEYLNNNGVKLDEFLQEITINGKLIEEIDNNTLYINMNQHFGVDVSRSRFENIMKSHLVEKFHPILAFIEKHKDRNPSGIIEQWVDCMVLKNPDVDRSVILHFVKKWYVGMVAQALDGEYPNEFFLSFTSTNQGIGKTTLLRKYTLPVELQLYRKEVSISDDEDFKVIMSQALLIIDDEMDGRTLNEDKTFKAILSRRELPLRRKYDRRISNMVRRCSFAGCGNQVNIVRERQNRRIIPIEVADIDKVKLAQVDLTDLFMEAYYLYRSGFTYSYNGTDSDKIKHLAGDYHLKSDLDEIIDECIDNPTGADDEHPVSSIQIINALNYKYTQMTRRISVPVIGKILADRGIQTKRVTLKGQKFTRYLIGKSSSIIKTINDLDSANNNPISGFGK
jgi:predicted P-loop ATPase